MRRLLTLSAVTALVAVFPVSPATATAPLSPAKAVCITFGVRCAPALRVARCESRLYPRALGSAGERGLFQIHPVHFGWLDESRLFHSLYNARIAFRLSRGGRDWSHWSCKP